MILGEFKEELRGAMKVGTSLDTRLDGFIRRAARWIEQNHTLQYMRRRFTVESVAGDMTLPLPPNVPIKAVEYLRFETPAGTWLECQKAEVSDPQKDWSHVDRYTAWPTRAVNPTHFYMDGVETLVFNRPWQESLPGVGILARYSDFPRQDNQTHWLLNFAEGLLLRQTMIEVLLDRRDSRAAESFVAKREEDIRALLNADYQMRFAGQELGGRL